ncbi:unnamed protein product [Prunus armeniaca]|uniref:Uncharacterized protein n=1 Tax=Prunus armeniaca TaxID=36596 RepID=A0A6J5XKZ9_PRUAR|nr:unnamed protein product [Prunus armeniaca]
MGLCGLRALFSVVGFGGPKILANEGDCHVRVPRSLVVWWFDGDGCDRAGIARCYWCKLGVSRWLASRLFCTLCSSLDGFFYAEALGFELFSRIYCFLAIFLHRRACC